MPTFSFATKQVYLPDDTKFVKFLDKTIKFGEKYKSVIVFALCSFAVLLIVACY
jgi:hypothetical protein